MGLLTKKILKIAITITSKEQILEEIKKYLEKAKVKGQKLKVSGIKPLIIFTPNPEIINFAQKDTNFKRIVNSAQINIPDGYGVVWAVKRLHRTVISKVSGVDLMLELSKMSARQGVRIGLIGGRGGVALATSECLRKKYPGLKVVVFEAPEMKIKNSKLKIDNYRLKRERSRHLGGGQLVLSVVEGDSPEVEELEKRYFYFLVNEIRKRKIDILFVALGFPKQEYFIDKLVSSWFIVHRGEKNRTISSERTNKLTMNPLVLMAVGGAFDYISGRVPRAPVWMKERGLEWLFRLIKQPWRIARQMKGAEFFWKVINYHPSFKSDSESG